MLGTYPLVQQLCERRSYMVRLSCPPSQFNKSVVRTSKEVCNKTLGLTILWVALLGITLELSTTHSRNLRLPGGSSRHLAHKRAYGSVFMPGERSSIPNLAYCYSADRLLLCTLVHGPSAGLIEPASSVVGVQDPESGFTETTSN